MLLADDARWEHGARSYCCHLQMGKLREGERKMKWLVTFHAGRSSGTGCGGHWPKATMNFTVTEWPAFLFPVHEKYNENIEEWLRIIAGESGGSNYEIGSRKGLGKCYPARPTYFILCLAAPPSPWVSSLRLVCLGGHVCITCPNRTRGSHGVNLLGRHGGD